MKKNTAKFIPLIFALVLMSVFIYSRDEINPNKNQEIHAEVLNNQTLFYEEMLEPVDIVHELEQIDEAPEVVEIDEKEKEQNDEGRTFEDVIRQAGPEGTNNIVVNITPIERETFRVIQAKLDDPSFYSTLNLNEFMQSAELQSLPKTLQLLLLSKASDLYNKGYIDREAFIGIATN